MPLEAFNRETTTTLPSRSFRIRGPYDSTTLATHWDGTYRDRLTTLENWPYPEFFPDEAKPKRSAGDLAKHLAAA